MTTTYTYIPLKIASFTAKFIAEEHKRWVLHLCSKKKINPTVLHAKIRIALKLAKDQQLTTFDIECNSNVGRELRTDVYKMHLLIIMHKIHDYTCFLTNYLQNYQLIYMIIIMDG